VVQFFKQEKELKLNVKIATVTNEAEGVSERLMKTILKKVKDLLRKGVMFLYM
jgi:hypothetical protein